jgi:hypothetical protein
MSPAARKITLDFQRVRVKKTGRGKCSGFYSRTPRSTWLDGASAATGFSGGPPAHPRGAARHAGVKPQERPQDQPELMHYPA